MRLVLVPAFAALAISCVQAAPQFDNPQSWGWGTIDITVQDQRPTGHQNPNIYGAQQPVYPQFQGQNDHGPPKDDRQGSSNQLQCWDPVSHSYRDWPNMLNPAPPQFPSQFHNNEFLGGNHWNPQMGPNPYLANQFPGSWDQSRPDSYVPPFPRRDLDTQRGPSPPPPPPPHHEHGHGHRRGHGGPPPHHGHVRPPPPHHGHGHGHGPPRPPPGHGYGYGHGPPPPPHRPPYNQQNVGDNILEICKNIPNTVDASVESAVTPAQGEPYPTTMGTSYPELHIPDTTAKAEGTETTTPASVKVTTEFDWNNFFLEASPDNPGGAGVIDVRMGDDSPVPTSTTS